MGKTSQVFLFVRQNEEESAWQSMQMFLLAISVKSPKKQLSLINLSLSESCLMQFEGEIPFVKNPLTRARDCWWLIRQFRIYLILSLYHSLGVNTTSFQSTNFVVFKREACWRAEWVNEWIIFAYIPYIVFLHVERMWRSSPVAELSSTSLNLLRTSSCPCTTQYANRVRHPRCGDAFDCKYIPKKSYLCYYCRCVGSEAESTRD